MLEKYIDWDQTTIELLRRHEENAVALVNLRDEYASLTDGLGAIDYTRDRVAASGDGDNVMVNRYIRKATIEARIKELTQEERQYSRAWEALAEDEKRVLSEFFQCGRRPSQDAVDTLCEVYGYERRKIYQMRKEALERFKRLLVG